LELCLEGEPSPLVFPLLFGRYTFLIGRARVEEALELAKLFFALAERNSHMAGQVIGHRMIGLARLGLGDTHGAREAVEHSLHLYVPERDGAVTELFGQNAQVHGSALLSLALFCLGEIDTAFRVGIEALRAADELHHPISTAIALGYVGGWVFGLSGAADLLMREVRRLIRISEQHQLRVFRHLGEAMLGWALCQQGSLDQGIAALEQANAALEAAEWRLSGPGLLAILADAKRRCGMLAEARTLSERAVAAASVADRWIEPEVLRIAALIAAETAPGAPEAPALARRAVACARRVASPVFELRCLETLNELTNRSERPEIEARLKELAAFRDLDRRLRKELEAR
jgi:tetratricopeptide (TPR) repeat protein